MFGDEVLTSFYRALFQDNIILSWGVGAVGLQIISRKMTDAILFFMLILLASFFSLSSEYFLLLDLSKIWAHVYYFKLYIFIVLNFLSLKFLMLFLNLLPYQGFYFLYEKNKLSLYLALLAISIFSLPDSPLTSWEDSILVGMGYALGYGLVAILLAGLYEKLKAAEIPVALQGTGMFLIALIFIYVGFVGLWRLF